MKRFLFLAIIATFAIMAHAQNELDHVFLKNGNVVKGAIETVKENQSVTIRSTNGELYTYPMIEVNRIAYGKSPNLPSEKNTNSYKDYSFYDKGFWCAVELQGGYSCNIDSYNVALSELDIVGGYRFNEYFRAGLGLGVRYYFNNEKVRYSDIKWAFPIFANVRGNIISGESRTVVPYYSVDLGGTIRDGFMFRPTIGLRIGESRSAFLVGLSYMGQTLKSYKAGKDNTIVPDYEYTSFVTLKLGYEF